jgi:hypothetical protein
MNTGIINDLLTDDELIAIIQERFAHLSVDGATNVVRALRANMVLYPNMTLPDHAAMLLVNGDIQLSIIILTIYLLDYRVEKSG